METVPVQNVTRPPDWSAFWKALFIMGGLPCFLLMIGGWFVEVQEKDLRIQEQFEKIERGLMRLKREGNDSFYILRELNRAYGLLTENKPDRAAIQSFQRAIRSAGLGFIQIHFFDRQGEAIEYDAAPKEHRQVMRRLYSALSEPESIGENKLLQQYRPVFRSFLGDVDPENLVTEKGNLVRVTLKGNPGYFYWNTLYFQGDPGERKPGVGSQAGNIATNPVDTSFQGGMVAVFEETPHISGLAVRKLLREFRSLDGQGCVFGVLNLASETASHPRWSPQKHPTLSWARLRQRLLGMRNSFQRRVVTGDALAAILPLDGQNLLYGIQPLAPLGVKPPLPWYTVAAIFLMGLMGRWCHQLFIQRDRYYVSIQQKLVWLVLFASAVPAAAFLLLGYRYSLDRQRVLVQERYSQLADRITTVDDNYLIAQQRLSNLYSRLLKSRVLKGRDFKSFERITDRLKKKRILLAAYVGDSSGELVFKTKSTKGNDLALRLVPTIIRRMFGRKGIAEGGGMKNLFADAMVDSIADGVAELVTGAGSKKALDSILEKTGELQEFRVGNRSQYIFTGFVPGPKGPLQSILAITQPRWDLADFYVKWVLKNNRPGKRRRDPIRVGTALTFGERKIQPVEYAKYPFIREMIEKVQTSTAFQFGEHEIAGERFLVAAGPGTKINEYILFALFPKSIIDGQMTQLHFRIIGISVVSIFFAFCVGLLLTRQFLWPINCLSQGIAAIGEHRFDKPIPLLDRDELGDLGLTFNRVMQNLEEIHVARVVQTTLFPSPSLVLGEYEIWGSSRSMSELGGDYFDYFILEKRWIVLVMGDVTGHGVPAALLMAMAKSALSILPVAEIVAVSDCLEKLNMMVFSTVKKQRLMTFFLGVIDTNEHRLRSANAGHVFPLMIQPGSKEGRWLENVTIPLGARKKQAFPAVEVVFSEGDVLVLYTDGLIEAQTRSGEPIGCDALLQEAANGVRSGDSAQAIHDHLLGWHTSKTGGQEPEDDLSLVIVRRKKASR